jgi:hypothetical protein
MGRERIEGEIEPVTGKEGEATGSQERSPGVDDPMCYVLGAGTERKHGKNLGARVDSQPEPEHLCGAAQPGSPFVQLEVREVEMAKGPLVQGLCVRALSGQPGGDGGLSKAEHTLGLRGIQPFGQRVIRTMAT